MSVNPFDLTKLVAADSLVENSKQKMETYTPDEQKDMLKDYVCVPRNKWLQLEIGTRIRYIRNNGEIRKGGFIQYIDKKNEYLMVSTFMSGINVKYWKLPISGVSEIWRAKNSKPPSGDHPILTPMRDKQTLLVDKDKEILTLKEDIRQLKIEIQRVMDQQKRIIISVGKNAVRLDKIFNTGHKH